MFLPWFTADLKLICGLVNKIVRRKTVDTHDTLGTLMCKAYMCKAYGRSPENGSATIFDDWRLPARLSSTSYSFAAFLIMAQSFRALAGWVLCLMSASWVLKIRKHSLFVHLNPIKQDPLGGAWLISEKTMNIPSNRNFCNGVTERISSTLYCQWFLKFTVLKLRGIGSI